MSSNFTQPGSVLTLVAPYDVLAGKGAKVGAIFGVAMNDVLSAASGEFAVEGVFNLKKIGSQAWTQGQRIYWDDTNKRCTSVATDGMLIGVATEAVGAGAGVVLGNVKLNESVAEGDEGPQAAVADVGAATAVAPAAVSAYAALSNLTNPVTKTEGEALSTEAAALRLSAENLRAQVAALVIDVAAIRSSYNTLLAELRIRGTIAP